MLLADFGNHIWTTTEAPEHGFSYLEQFLTGSEMGKLGSVVESSLSKYNK